MALAGARRRYSVASDAPSSPFYGDESGARGGAGGEPRGRELVHCLSGPGSQSPRNFNLFEGTRPWRQRPLRAGAVPGKPPPRPGAEPPRVGGGSRRTGSTVVETNVVASFRDDPQTGVALGSSPGPQCAFEMSMLMCPAVHTTTRSLLRLSSTHEPSDPPLRVVYTKQTVSCASLPAKCRRPRQGHCAGPPNLTTSPRPPTARRPSWAGMQEMVFISYLF